MRIVSFLELGQRLILVMLPAWFFWCMLMWIAAPYRPDDFLLAIFVCSLLVAYVASVWVVSAVIPVMIPGRIWPLVRLLISAILGFLPFMITVVSGHFLALATRAYLS